MSTDSVTRLAPDNLAVLIYDGEIVVGKVQFVADVGVGVSFEFTYSAGTGGVTRERAGRSESELASINIAEDTVTIDFPNETYAEAGTPPDGVLAGTITTHVVNGYNDYHPVVTFDSGDAQAVIRGDISGLQELGSHKTELDSQKRCDDVDSDMEVAHAPAAADEQERPSIGR